MDNGIMMMSYFNAPIAPIRDAEGRVIRKASVMPQSAVSVEQVFNLITQDERIKRLTELVRTAADFKAAKTAMLPYVTPCGVFSYRKSSALVSLSGLMPIDIDGLPSRREAEAMRDAVFDDPYLQPVLVFVSPSGRGVKAFIRIDNGQLKIDNDHADNNVRTCHSATNCNLSIVNSQLTYAMEYVRMIYGSCDASGKDIARSCFLCHDAGAKCRMNVFTAHRLHGLHGYASCDA